MVFVLMLLVGTLNGFAINHAFNKPPKEISKYYRIHINQSGEVLNTCRESQASYENRLSYAEQN